MEFDIRSQLDAFPGRPFDLSYREKLLGRRVLFFSEPESGVGDIIQFSRYLELLTDVGAQVRFAVPSKMVRLFQSLPWDVDVIPVDGLTVDDFDCYLSLCSAPDYLHAGSILWPRNGPYLSAEHDRVKRWAERLNRQPVELLIAICWAGKPDGDQGRDVPLKEFGELAESPAIRFVSLQQGEARKKIMSMPWRDRIVDLGPEIDGDGTFLDSAAILKSVNLMITSDTGPAHLAGALGVPVWMALRFRPDVRWRHVRRGLPKRYKSTETKWYPTMRLFRQIQENDWSHVFAAMRDQLSGIQIMAGGLGPRAPLLRGYGDV